MQEQHLILSHPLTSEPLSETGTPSQKSLSTTIMEEGFEGSFPSAGWTVFDGNGPTNGEYYWDDDDYKPRTGSWSAWPANGGANGLDPQFYYYPNSLTSWMIYGPFSLADAAAASLSFYYWLDTEVDFDWFGWYASIDGSNFYGDDVSGESHGWISGLMDLTDVYTLGDITGQPSVWIAFIFDSDISIAYDGVFLDDILLQKSTSPSTSDEIGVFRNGQWFLDLSGNDFWDGCAVDGCLYLGMAGDQAAVGDWDGDGDDEIGVFRNGQWFLDLSGNDFWDGCTVDGCVYLGMAGDQAAVGDWDGDGDDEIGVFRNGQWFLDFSGNDFWDGCVVDGCVYLGMAGDGPLCGKW